MAKVLSVIFEFRFKYLKENPKLSHLNHITVGITNVPHYKNIRIKLQCYYIRKQYLEGIIDVRVHISNIRK